MKRKPDQWGLAPVRAGMVRGQIANVRRSIGVCDFGELIIMDFDLVRGEGVPAVPVQMTGTDFVGPLNEGWLAELPDPDPTVRPIVTSRLAFPPNYDNDLIAYYPGRMDKPANVMRLRGLLMVVSPVVFALAVLGLFLTFFG